jgi:hypothetical protein
LILRTQNAASPKLPLAARTHEGATAAGEILTSVGWGFTAVPTAASFLVSYGRSPGCFGWAPGAAIIMFYRPFTAAALVVHFGTVVLDAPRPTSQPAEEAQSAGRDSRKHD